MIVVIVTLLTASSPRAQQRSVFRSGTELVLVNVVVRDKSGAVVRNLSRDDFTVTEDDKSQTITSFDFEELAPSPEAKDRAASATQAAPSPAANDGPASAAQGTSPRLPTDAVGAILSSPDKRNATAPAEQSPAAKVDMRGRRLIVLFFDLSSMQPEELDRAVKAAHDYVEHKLSAADLIAIASFSTSLQVVQDFTADADALRDAIDGFGSNNAAGFDNGLTGDVEDTPDTGNAFTADDTEFNIFNTDRRLDALRTLADQLAGIEQKKSVIYFSSGVSQQGQDNQVQLRRTVDRANRANVSIYAAACADCRRSSREATRPKAADEGRHLSPAPRRETSSGARPPRKRR